MVQEGGLARRQARDGPTSHGRAASRSDLRSPSTSARQRQLRSEWPASSRALQASHDDQDDEKASSEGFQRRHGQGARQERRPRAPCRRSSAAARLPAAATSPVPARPSFSSRSASSKERVATRSVHSAAVGSTPAATAVRAAATASPFSALAPGSRGSRIRFSRSPTTSSTTSYADATAGLVAPRRRAEERSSAATAQGSGRGQGLLGHVRETWLHT